ncbi:MAG: polysaccharide pyruvyl transferase family protein [Bacteroidales bacterium]
MKLSRIGILTFHRSQNYGAVLQAYALSVFLNKNGFKAEIIDYWPAEMQEFYRLIPNFRYRNLASKIKGILLLLVGLRKELKRRKGFFQFVHKHFNLTQEKYTQQQQLEPIAFDAVIYGSDQIWWKHPFTYTFDPVYWGTVPLSGKKIAYGASCSSLDFSEQDYQFIAKMLKNFDAIGVREKVLADILASLSSKQISLVIDPVFLLDKTDWLELIKESNLKLPQKPYLLFYHLNYNPETTSWVNTLAKQLNLNVIELRGRVFPLKFGSRYVQTASPIDFLNLLQNAQVVVSNSFHGTAFSVLFEKNFYVVGANKGLHRMLNLLECIGLENRIVQSYNAIKFESINFGEVRPKIKAWKQSSINFLRENLNF